MIKFLFASMVYLALSVTVTSQAQTTRGASSRPSTTSTMPASAPAKIKYLGRERTTAWVAAMWKKHGPDIAIHDGKYYDIGRSKLVYSKQPGELYIHKEPPAEGETRAIPYGCKVLKVVKAGEIIAVQPAFHARSSGTSQWDAMQAAALSRPEIVFHVVGLDTSRLADDADLKECLVLCIGTYSQSDGEGGKSTIQNYVVPRQVTQDEFVKGLADGDITLVDYSFSRVNPNPNKPGSTNGLIHTVQSSRQGKTQQDIWLKVIETKVP